MARDLKEFHNQLLRKMRLDIEFKVLQAQHEYMMEKPLGNLHIMTGPYRQRDNLRRNKALRAMKREMIFETQIRESLAQGF